MLNIGMTELLIFGVIALLVLGPDKLPEAVRFVGKWYGKMKRTVSSIQNDFDRELRLSELREQMQAEMQRIQELEAKMQAQMAELQQPVLPPSNAVDKTIQYQPVSIHRIKAPLVYRAQQSHIKTIPMASTYTDMKVAV